MVAANKEAPRTELGNVVSLDHVNLRVPDQRLATLFYLEGLGLTRDPYRMTSTGNMWVNIGAQQFHLPTTTQPMPFPGEIGLVVPDLDKVRERLERVTPQLKETAFGWRENKATLVACDPWGRRIRLHPAGALPAMMNLALAYVEIWVPPGSAAAIGRFYGQILAVPCSRNGGRKASGVTVTVGPHQSLRFVERADAPTQPHNNHVALYLTRYREIYDRMRKLRNLMEKNRHEQFRFNRILDLKTGKCLLEIEHEMRSLYHGDYGRTLVNRGDAGERIGQVIGRDT